ncbi:hypothetical protein ACFLUQ_02020 [Chloroflexota bacterium]
MKLQLRVPLLVIVTLLVIGTISSGMMLYSRRKASVAPFEQTATTLASAVQSSLQQSMTLGERQHIQEAMVRIGEELMVSKVALFSPNGAIVASSELSKIGKLTARDEIQGALQSGEASIWTDQEKNEGELLIVTPILSKPECQSCHSSESSVLGVIEVGLNTTL